MPHDMARKQMIQKDNNLIFILLVVIDEFLHYLDGVGGSTFAEVVGNDPEVEGARLGEVAAYTAHEYLVASLLMIGMG